MVAICCMLMLQELPDRDDHDYNFNLVDNVNNHLKD